MGWAPFGAWQFWKKKKKKSQCHATSIGRHVSVFCHIWISDCSVRSLNVYLEPSTLSFWKNKVVISSLSNREIQERTPLWGGRADTEAMAGDQDPDLVQGKSSDKLTQRTAVSQSWAVGQCPLSRTVGTSQPSSAFFPLIQHVEHQWKESLRLAGQQQKWKWGKQANASKQKGTNRSFSFDYLLTIWTIWISLFVHYVHKRENLRDTKLLV